MVPNHRLQLLVALVRKAPSRGFGVHFAGGHQLGEAMKLVAIQVRFTTAAAGGIFRTFSARLGRDVISVGQVASFFGVDACLTDPATLPDG